VFDAGAALARLAREPDTHKGHFGHVLVLGGSTGFVGAACLAAQAALRSGAGLVTLGVPQSLLPIVAAKLTSCMTRGYPELPDGAFALGALRPVLADVPQHSVIALGPGIGRRRATAMLVHALLRRVERPLVLDADGLNALEGQADILDLSPAPRVLTPHPGEMARLAGRPTTDVQANRMAVASEFASRHRVVVVLKGAGTIVADGRRTLANETGNPGMATGGSGDVLTGLVAGLLAQGLAPFEAACLAVRVHGRAGDLAASVLGELSMTADDILDALPDAFLSTAPSIDPEE
jgi:NAD(P)H-hydrate epimerase